ncbi:pilus assembly FimT family protein [Nannocystaceae bacterium ST9]
MRISIHRKLDQARARAARGLSLIEILVVLFILGLIMWSASVSMGAASQAEVIRSTNQLAASLRFAYDRARFTGQHYRVHIDFEKRSFQLQRAEEAMYLPATDRDGELIKFDAKKAEAKAARDKAAAEAYFSTLAAAIYAKADEGEDGAMAGDPYKPQPKDVPRARPPLFEAFEDDQTLGELGKPIVLPEGVEILSVQTDSDPLPITSGQADIYFFPRGQTQLTHIQLKGKPKLRDRIIGEDDIEYTIIVQPLTGKVRVEAELIDLKLPKAVGEGKDELGNETERRSF